MKRVRSRSKVVRHETIPLFNNNGGLVTNLNPKLKKKSQLDDLINVEYDKIGVFSRRDGSEKQDYTSLAEDQTNTTGAVLYPINIRNGTYSTNYWEAQSFQAGVTGYLESVSLKLKRIGSPKASIHVCLYSDDSGDPGSEISNISIPASSVSTDSDWYTFYFPGNVVSVTSGTTYWIVLKAIAYSWGGLYNNSNKVSHYYDQTGNPYANGVLSHTTNAGSTWGAINGGLSDMQFKTYAWGASGLDGVVASMFSISRDAYGSFPDPRFVACTGQKIYALKDDDSWQLLKTHSNAGHFFDMVYFQNLYVASSNPDNPIQKWDTKQTTSKDIDIPQPSAAVTAAEGAAAGTVNFPNGETFIYRIKYVMNTGAESVASPEVAITMTADREDVDLSNLPTNSSDPYVVARNIYRTEGDGRTFYFLAQIPNNTATTYEDKIPDSELTGADTDTDDPIPAACTAAKAAGAGLEEGVYKYKIKFLMGDSAGTLSSAGPEATVTTDASNKQVALTNISINNTDPNVIKRYIYRTKVGGSTYYLLAILDDNTTTSYTDLIADSALTQEMGLSAKFYPQSTCLCAFRSRMWYAGAGTGSYKNYLFPSEIDESDNIDAANAIDTIARFEPGDDIKRMWAYGKFMYVFLLQSIYKVAETFTDIPFIVTKVKGDQGIMAPFTLVETKEGTFFLTNKKEFVHFDGFNPPETISKAIQDELNLANDSYLDRARAVYYKGKNEIWLSFPSASSEGNDKTYKYDLNTKTWSENNGFTAASYWTVRSEVDATYRGDYSGFVYKMGQGTADDNNPVIASIKKKYFFDRVRRINVVRLFGTGTINLKIYLDGSSTAHRAELDIALTEEGVEVGGVNADCRYFELEFYNDSDTDFQLHGWELVTPRGAKLIFYKDTT